MMQDPPIEYEEDAVDFGTSNIRLEGARSKPCVHCSRRMKAEYKSVEVQTSRPEMKLQEKNQSAPQHEKSDLIMVPRDQLAVMQKYYMAVKDAYYNYSLTDGDSKAVVKKLFEQTPEVLSATNREGRSPIESALAQGKWTAGAQLLDLAGRRNPRALWHRTSSGEDALMLAVAGGNEATVSQLISQGLGRDACLHYDVRGRNCLHLCALGSNSKVLDILLAELSDQLSNGKLSADCVTEALCTSDCDGCTPLHYMARDNRTRMLQSVHEFSQRRRLRPDWDARQARASDHRLTPLAMAAEADALEACEFLLQRGLAGIDLHDQRDLWLQAALSDSVRDLLAPHCRLLEPMGALPSENLQLLQDRLDESGLAEEFLLQLRTHWPDLPQLPTVVTVLAACQNFSGSCRLVVWDILQGLGTGDLAQLLEA